MHFPMNFRSYLSLSFAHNPLSFSYSLMSVPTCVATCNTSPISNITSLFHSTMNNHQEVSPSSPHPQPLQVHLPITFRHPPKPLPPLRMIVLTNFPQKNLFFPFAVKNMSENLFCQVASQTTWDGNVSISLMYLSLSE